MHKDILECSEAKVPFMVIKAAINSLYNRQLQDRSGLSILKREVSGLQRVEIK